MSLPYSAVLDSMISALGEAATHTSGTTSTTITACFGIGTINVNAQDGMNQTAVTANIRIKASAITGSPKAGDNITRTATGEVYKILSVLPVCAGLGWAMAAQRIE